MSPTHGSRTTPARRRFVGLCLPPMILCALDGALTLAGQPGAYWQGRGGSANELSPTFHALLVWHPLAFVAGLAVWAVVFSSGILLANLTLALIFSIAIAFGHTVGAMSWLAQSQPYGYQACNLLALATAALLGLGARHATRSLDGGDELLFALSSAKRWAIVAGLFAVGAYLFLWPRG